MKRLRVSGVLFGVGLLASTFRIEADTTPKKKKGPVVDLGTLDVEGESRQPNLQLIEGPAIRDKILKKVFSDSLRRVESELLQPANAADFPELKGGSRP